MIAEDQLRIIISMVITIPLSYVIPKIPNALARQLYSLIVGTLIQYYIYGQDIILVFALHIFVYFVTMLTPRNCGQIVTWSTLGFLSFFHIYRMVVDYGGWNLDISTIIMSNICKYSFFSYSYQDGQSVKNSGVQDKQEKKQNSSKLSQQQNNQKIETFPSLLKFIGYCQFLPGSPISTPFPYKYYQDYIQLRNQYSKIPSPWDQIKSDISYSIILVLLYLPNMFIFPLATMKDASFANQGFWYILYFSFFCVTTLRFKYYFAWKLSLGAIHASGVSFQTHKNGASDFKLIQTCNPHIVETTVHIREKISNWNMTCQQWLRKCIYERNHFKNKTHGQMLTFLVSSFWHGFYGGYYFTFVLWFIQLFTSQIIFKQCKNQKSKFMKIYNLTYPFSKYVVWIIWNISFTICGIFFQVLSSSQSFRLLKSLYFTPFLFFIVIHCALKFGGTRQKRDKKKVGQETKVQ